MAAAYLHLHTAISKNPPKKITSIGAVGRINTSIRSAQQHEQFDECPERLFLCTDFLLILRLRRTLLGTPYI